LKINARTFYLDKAGNRQLFLSRSRALNIYK
jgi:hypothetical protein